MELLSNFNFNLIYCPSHKLIQVNAISYIYIQKLKLDGEFDPDQPIQYPLMKKENYYPEISDKTLKKLIKNKDKFKVK